MANSPQFYAAGVNGAVNGTAALLNNGFLEIFTGPQPGADNALSGVLLVTLTFGATAFGSSSVTSSVASAAANAITSGTAGATGTAGYFALLKSDGTTVVGTGSVGTSGSDLNVSSTSISSGATVSCSAFTLSLPEHA